MKRGSKTVGDKLHSRKGNNPDQQLRCQNNAQWKGSGISVDSEDVGLEAATI
jgi:hypothetical protein